jgi:hypothetical protein
MKLMITTAILPAALLLSACGGGGGSVGPAPSQPSPAAIDVASLVAFASENPDSTTTTRGVVRQTRQFEEGGRSGVVVLDQLAGSDVGLVQYRLGNDVFVYSTTGEPVAGAAMPGGTYSGTMDMNYTFDSASAPGVLTGDVGMNLDIATGMVSMSSLASNANHSIEVFGDAALVDNAFTMTNANAVLRDQANGGVFVRNETVTVDGIAATNANGSAMFGTVEGFNAGTGFAVEGGFAAGHVP